MITLPEDVLQADVGEVGFSWDGESPHPQEPDKLVPNKETTMDWAEHQRITCNAGKLLVSWTTDKHAGEGKKAFKALKDAYVGSNKGRSVLRVSKGIHQPEVNPHLQVRVVSTFYDGKEVASVSRYTFHLDVAATEVKDVDGLEDRFQWEGVQFKYKDGGNWYSWPALPAPRKGKNATPSRRASISYASLSDHLNKLAEQEAQRLKQEKLAKEQLLAATLETKIQSAVEALKTNEGLVLRQLKNEPAKNFFKGTAKTYFVHQYGHRGKGGYYIWDAKAESLVKTI
jgi:hypothetical protein